MLLTLLLACSDPPAPSTAPVAPPSPGTQASAPADPPSPRQAPGPSAAAPGALLVRGPDCGLSLLRLPAGDTEVLVSGLPCAEGNLVLDADGQRALVGRILVDLRTGDPAPLPSPPSPSPDAESLLTFAADGQVLAFLRWGEEEIGFEEGPVYARNLEVVYTLVDGAWVERARWVTGPELPVDEAARDAWIAASRARGVALLADAGAGEFVIEGPLRDALVAVAPGDWIAAGSAGGGARFAWRLEQQGEGTVSPGPLRVFDGAGWFPVEGTDDRALLVSAEGDWLVVTQQDTWWALDLSNGAVAATGQGAAWPWPARIPLPETCTLSSDALTPALVGAAGASPQVRREGRAVIEWTALPDGAELERQVGGCHHLLVAYTWRGGATEAEPLPALARRLEALPLQDPADGVRAQLVQAAREARAEAGETRVDVACGEASCGFSWGEEQGRAVLRAEYMFTL
ncbi:hypothetical protein L6R53_20210 [Myxococcota bacterium]|nr:hypothetical protein [Myxococcota bacterium]